LPSILLIGVKYNGPIADSEKVEPMRPPEPLQNLINPFVKQCGGEIVAEELDTGTNLLQNADYLFRNAGVIAELKSLEDDTFGESFRAKMGDLADSWQRRGLLIVFGTTRVDLHRLPPVCQHELLELIAGPLQTKIFAKANQQIRSTKKLLDLPDAKGLVMVASDGNESLPPMDVLYFLGRILRKKHPNGMPQYSNIHSLLYFNPRMPAAFTGSDQPALVWATVPRLDEDQEMTGFLNALGDQFRGYMERTTAVRFGEAAPIKGHRPTLGFLGVAPQMPRIRVTDPPRVKPPRKA
jgi:hypothetical protein